MEITNVKETISLLGLSDNESDISDLILTPKKKKIKRRHRQNGSIKTKPDNSCCCKRSQMRAASLWLASVLIIIWLITLSWLAVILYGELKKMDVSVKSVIAGSEGVPDALQTCHTLDRNFKTNITHITDEIQKLNRSLNTFSGQISSLQQELQQVQVSLKSAPALTSDPNTINSLQNTVVQLEIDFHDLRDTNKKLNDSLQRVQDEQSQNLTKIQNKVASLQDLAQNASAQILSLNQECAKRKDQEVLRGLLEALSVRMEKLSGATAPPQPTQAARTTTAAAATVVTTNATVQVAPQTRPGAAVTTEASQRTSVAPEAPPAADPPAPTKQQPPQQLSLHMK